MPAVAEARARRRSPAGGDPRRHAVQSSQRLRIIHATAACARRRELADVSVMAIIEAAGVSRRTYYELFANLEEGLAATFEEGVSRACVAMVPAYGEQRYWRGAVRAGLAALLGLLEDQPVLGGFCVSFLLAGGPLMRRRRERLVGVLVHAVDAGRLQARPPAGLSPLLAESIVGGVLSVLQRRLLTEQRPALSALQGELMALIVRPYLGAAAARDELLAPAPTRRGRSPGGQDPLGGVRMRLTYTTIAVIQAVARHPGSSNRAVGQTAGVHDQGQLSKLLHRLQGLDVVENRGGAHSGGIANAWHLSARGVQIAAQLSARPAVERKRPVGEG
jgi:AcrR family transcriptional regulator